MNKEKSYPTKKIKEEKIDISKAARNSHQEDMVDHYWFSINYVHSLIKASELKAGLILSFYGIFLNFMYQAREFLSSLDNISIYFYALIGIWGICTTVSIFFSIRCFIPKIEDKFETNVFFFKDIISKYGNAKSFSKTFYNISMDEKTVFDHLGQQIFINSKIADWKFKNVNLSIRYLAFGLGLFLVLCVTYFVANLF